MKPPDVPPGTDMKNASEARRFQSSSYLLVSQTSCVTSGNSLGLSGLLRVSIGSVGD